MKAISLKITFTICVLTTLFFTSIECSRSFTPQEEVDLVTKVCKKTRYYSLCMTLLYQDTRSWKCDTKGLAKLVMEEDLKVAKQILVALQSLSQDKGKSPIVREICSKCFGEYNNIVLTLLPNANEALDSDKHGAAIQLLNSIANFAKACDEEFSKGGVPLINRSVHQISMLAANIIEII